MQLLQELLPMPNGSYRILIVNDSAAARRILKDAISSDPRLEIAGMASNGGTALTHIQQLKPDLMVLDAEMPERNGLATLAELRKTNRHLPVIMLSDFVPGGERAMLDALSLGANGYLSKKAVTAALTGSLDDLRSELLPKIHALCERNRSPKPSADSQLLLKLPTLPRPQKEIAMVVVGVSTGGPQALLDFLPGIPRDFPVPVVVVQHMPAIFTSIFATRLQSKCSLPVQEVAGGEPVTPGVIWLAPGGKHLRLSASASGVVLELDTSPPRNFCRPSVDVLFESAVKLYGPATLAVVLTGMGIDGLKGCEVIHQRGGQVVVQDEETSVVWGMPGAVARAKLADSIKPLSQMRDEVLRRVMQYRGDHRGATPMDGGIGYVQPGK
jgi:two-component system chemotaxis response regulator CheB